MTRSFRSRRLCHRTVGTAGQSCDAKDRNHVARQWVSQFSAAELHPIRQSILRSEAVENIVHSDFVLLVPYNVN